MTLNENPSQKQWVRFSVAPMMDWTDRRCRAFHRQFTRRALLFTEMITAEAVIFGRRERLLGFDAVERPLALQLGGSDPDRLREASAIAADYGYDEINLNVGCPSDRVREGRFGACLMREPGLVGACLAAMAAGAPGCVISVKCRIGVDEQEPGAALFALADAAAQAGVRRIYVHARKAWLNGLSPKENREIPPLQYEWAHALKAARPELQVWLNGGLEDVAHGAAQSQGLDGMMLGRAAYQTPSVLFDVDPMLHGEAAPTASRGAAVRAHMDYVAANLARGVPLHAMTKHMLGLFHGRPAGRIWRRTLSEEGVRAGAGIEVLQTALAAVERAEEMVNARSS